MSKNTSPAPTIRSSVAEYLTFIAVSELDEDSVIRNFRITAKNAKNYNAKHYSEFKIEEL